MLAMITKQTIHEEAKTPSYDVVEHKMHRRWNYLGHILRLDINRAVRKYLIELSPAEAPFIKGSLLDDTDYKTVQEMEVVDFETFNQKAASSSKFNNISSFAFLCWASRIMCLIYEIISFIATSILQMLLQSLIRAYRVTFNLQVEILIKSLETRQQRYDSLVFATGPG